VSAERGSVWQCALTPTLLMLKTLLFLMTTGPLVAQGLPLAQRANLAAASLPKGCIVIAEQTGKGAPNFSLSGKAEPAGVAPERLIFNIGSISKVFTGLLLAQAVRSDKLRMESTLREVMGKEQSFASEHVAAITLEQLATHTSGLPRIPKDLLESADPEDPYAAYNRAALNRSISMITLDHAPPFASEYSNLGVGLLGDILARLEGKTWEELVIQHITDPLGMKDTRMTLSQEQKSRLAPPYDGADKTQSWRMNALAGAGALHSTAADLMLLAQALSRPADSPLRELIEMAEQPRAEGNVGLCLQITGKEGAKGYWHNGGGGGYHSWMSARPKGNSLVVLLINNDALPAEEVFTAKAETPAP
jgi:serine-type D-Ala-D-Ala carboxypeptidase/endopeptidase